VCGCVWVCVWGWVCVCVCVFVRVCVCVCVHQEGYTAVDLRAYSTRLTYANACMCMRACNTTHPNPCASVWKHRLHQVCAVIILCSVCSGVLQCVVAHCSVLQWHIRQGRWHTSLHGSNLLYFWVPPCILTHTYFLGHSIPQRTCNPLQHSRVHTATHCNKLHQTRHPSTWA